MRTFWYGWKNKLALYLRIGVSLLLIGWLVRSVDTAGLARALVGADLLLIALAVALVNADRVLMAYKWDLLLRAKGLHIPLRDLIGAYYKATFLGSFFLPTVGADAVRVYAVAQHARRSEDIISSVVIERVIGLVSTILVALLGLGLFIRTFDQTGWASFATLALLLLAVVTTFLVSLQQRWLRGIEGRLERFKGGVLATLGKILHSYQSYSHHRGTLVRFLFWSIFEQFFAIIHYYLLAEALHLEISLLTFAMFVPIIMVAMRLPVSFDGWGVREGLFVYFLARMGVPPSQAFLVGFVSPILTHIAIALPTLYFFLARGPSSRPRKMRAGSLPREEWSETHPF